jgi:hypothetical protein
MQLTMKKLTPSKMIWAVSFSQQGFIYGGVECLFLKELG